MDLVGYCIRCDQHFAGPDEGCPTCDKDNPDITTERNYHPSPEEISAFYDDCA